MAEEEVIQETVDEETEKGLFAWIKKHPKTTFWSRLVLWTILSWVLPCAFIVWRFKLFRKVGQIQIGGWGIVAIILTAMFIFTVIRYVKIAFSNRYTLIGQILGGLCKIVVPLLAMTLILYSVKDSINLMIQVMGCVTICEAVAIPLNPLPKWAYEKQKDVRADERKEAFDYLLDGFFKRKKDSGE